ncbi:MAG: hypothetical protein WC823_00575 [Parcubacteria group bacterium]|jgi:hypothetical protein
MSRSLVKDASLKGFDGPIDVSTDRLQDSLKGSNGERLESVCRTIPGHIKQFRPITSDGYTWFWAYSFRTNSGVVAVLIPWYQDWDKKDGSQADRAVAVYTQGATKAEVEEILEQFSAACLDE